SRAAMRAGAYTGGRPRRARSSASFRESASAPAMPARTPRVIAPRSIREGDALVNMRALLEHVEQTDGVVLCRNATLTARVHQQRVVTHAVAPGALARLDECRGAHVRPVELLYLAPELERFAVGERDGLPLRRKLGRGEQL